MGISVLGAAVSTSSAFVLSHAMSKVTKTKDMIDALLMIPDPQICLLLLRSCLGMVRLSYVWRTSHPTAIIDAMQYSQTVIISALRTIIVAQGPHFGEKQIYLSSLPVSLGGLGIALPLDIHHFAYLSSALSSWELQHQIFPSLDSAISEPIKDQVGQFLNLLLPTEDFPNIRKMIFTPNKRLPQSLAKSIFRIKGTDSSQDSLSQ